MFVTSVCVCDVSVCCVCDVSVFVTRCVLNSASRYEAYNNNMSVVLYTCQTNFNPLHVLFKFDVKYCTTMTNKILSSTRAHILKVCRNPLIKNLFKRSIIKYLT